MKYFLSILVLMLVGCAGVNTSEFSRNLGSVAGVVGTVGNLAGTVQNFGYGQVPDAFGVQNGLSTVASISQTVGSVSQGQATTPNFPVNSNISDQLSLVDSYIATASQDAQLSASQELLDVRRHAMEARSYALEARRNQGSYGAERAVPIYQSRANSSMALVRQDLVNLQNHYGDAYGVSQVIAQLQ